MLKPALLELTANEQVNLDRWLGLIGRTAHGPAKETGQQQDGVTQHWSLVADDLQFVVVTIAIGDVYPPNHLNSLN